MRQEPYHCLAGRANYVPLPVATAGNGPGFAFRCRQEYLAVMRRAEAQAVGRLAGEVLAGGGALIEQFHAGIAQRAFRSTPASAPARVIHDHVSRAIYAGVAGALRGAALAGGALAAQRTRPDGETLDTEPRGAIALAALSGFSGDRLARLAPELAPDMAIRVRGRPIAPDRAALRAAFPDATPRLAVFVHGLCETEHAWRLGQARPTAGGCATRSATRRSTCATTPDFTSRTTAAAWHACSISSTPRGRPTSKR